jgi:transcriptional regulator with XRE-family HTH domain
MGRKSKKDRPPALIQGILGANVRDLRARRYKALPTLTAQQRALAKSAQTTLSQIQRIESGALAPGIDMLELLALALEVRPQDLITPYFARAPLQEAEGSPFPESQRPPTAKKSPKS